jgi:hypothetical protein
MSDWWIKQETQIGSEIETWKTETKTGYSNIKINLIKTGYEDIN